MFLTHQAQEMEVKPHVMGQICLPRMFQMELPRLLGLGLLLIQL